MQSNYDKQVHIARELFVKYDQQKMMDLYNLKYDEDYLYMTFIGDKYRICRQDGSVELYSEELGEFRQCGDYNVVMTLYDVLCYPKETPRLAGEWCPLHSLQVTMSSPNADIFNQKYADTFAGKVDWLRQVCQSFGGMEPPITASSDMCWQFEIFSFFPLQFRFWDQDEEFPAKIQLLWDRNSLKFMHFETLYYVMGHLMKKISDRLMRVAE